MKHIWITYNIVFQRTNYSLPLQSLQSQDRSVFYGRDGQNGRDGRDGRDGRNGKDGKNGINGKNGKDGKDAISSKSNWKECSWRELNDGKDDGIIKVINK